MLISTISCRSVIFMFPAMVLLRFKFQFKCFVKDSNFSRSQFHKEPLRVLCGSAPKPTKILKFKCKKYL